jgi:asparagine synthetase B (glutamine-hydrolysing)
MTVQLHPLEVASDLVFGKDPDAPPLPPSGHLDALGALEAAVLPALERPPCLVSFSGGRDSSAILAVAVHVARREGLEEPVAATFRFAHPEAMESSWQELIIRELGIGEWQRVELQEELGVLGPIARKALKRHGLLWPFNSYAFVPLMEAARGGALLTGIDGDGLFGGWSWGRLVGVLGGRLRPVPRDALRLTRTVAPRALRRAWARRRCPLQLSWLRPQAQTALFTAYAAEAAAEPVRWRRRVEEWARDRRVSLFRSSYAVLASDLGTAVVHPFLDPQFLAALARSGPGSQYATRSMAMRNLFDGLLPRGVLDRSTKATFTEPLWGGPARAFAAHWKGAGVSADLVDRDELRRVWSAAVPDTRSAMCLQAAWLAEASGQSSE